MSRRRYPSDQRPYFRVLNDFLDDPKLGAACPDEVFRLYFRLLATLSRVGNKTGEITLDRHGLAAVCSRSHRDSVLKWSRIGAELGLYSLRIDGELAVISVPKWPEIQGFTPMRLRCDSDATPVTPLLYEESSTSSLDSARDSPAPAPIPSPVQSCWSSLREAAAGYGATWPARPGRGQVQLLQTRLKHYTAVQLVAAVHGYARKTNGLKPTDSFDPRKHFTLTTLLRASTIDANIEAATSTLGRKRSALEISAPKWNPTTSTP